MTFITAPRLAVAAMVLCISGLLAMLIWTDRLVPSLIERHYGVDATIKGPLSKILDQAGAGRTDTARLTVKKGEASFHDNDTKVDIDKEANSSVSKPTTSAATTTTTTKKPEQKQGIILQWAHPWAVDSEPPYQDQVFGNCKVTYDRSKHAEAIAVVFHYTVVPQPYPYPRNPNQFFVWYSWENPWVVRWLERKELNEFDNFFNWTMTYRRESDVYAPYNLMRDEYNKLPKGKDVVEKLVKEKKGLAIWVVSECEGKKGARMRMAYFKELIKTLPDVKKYGNCFGGRWPHVKMASLVRETKFYFAFENSLHCKDYITEKLYRNGFQYGAVPVVWGTAKKDYLAVAPPHSFIHAEDFSSPNELAKYLMYLDSNDTAYSEYFKWRENANMTWDDQRMEVERLHPGIKTRPEHTFWYEKLCELVQNGAPPKVIPSLRKIFLENDSEECVTKD